MKGILERSILNRSMVGCAAEALMISEREGVTVLVVDQRLPVTPGTKLVKQACILSPAEFDRQHFAKFGSV